MAASEPYAEPLLAHLRAEQILAVCELLWPFALTVCIGLLRWHRVRAKVGFLVLGVLGSFGLQAFLARLARYVVWMYLAQLEPGFFSAARHISDPIVIIAASAAASVPLLLWLADLMGVTSTSDSRSRGPP